jgi:periplasmic copper chaperone A
MTRAATLAVALLVLVVPGAAQAQLTAANAWLRPVAAGQKEAQLYVDLRATEPVKLVAASSPIARRAELVLLDPPDAQSGKLRVVSEIAVAPNAETRLAFRGSHVRLLDITRAANPGEHVAVELTFVAASGRRQSVSTHALVRGLVARTPDGKDIAASPGAK